MDPTLGELMVAVESLAGEVRRLRDDMEATLSSEMGEALFRSSPDAIVVVDAQFTIMLFNTQAELLFGWHRSELAGEPVERLIPEAVRGRHVRHRDGYLAAPSLRPMGRGLRLVGLHKSGAEIPVDINLSPIVTTGGMYVIATVRRERDGEEGGGRDITG